MDRRTLLKLLSATALVGCAPEQSEQSEQPGNPLNIVIAGAGIVGASIAYHLAKAGARVTVIDKVGPASHASRGTFAWINATWAKQPRSYHAFNQQSLSNWHDLAATLNLPIHWGGSLEWFDGAAREQKLVAQIAEQAAWGEDARMIGAAELAEMEPGVDFGDATQAAYSGNDGAVDPVVATNAMLAAAVSMGAVVKAPCALTGMSMKAGRLTAVETSMGIIKADRLVLATGADPVALKQFADVDVPQRTTPGIIAITKPLPRFLNSIIAAPGVHMHQRLDGRVVVGEQDGAPNNEAHAIRLEGRPNDYPERWIAEDHAARMFAVAEQFAPAMANAEVEDVFIGWRPLPLDGHPVVGASPNRPDVYMAVMHSGVTLAPIVGQLAAYELTSGESAPTLGEYRPGRNFELVKRY